MLSEDSSAFYGRDPHTYAIAVDVGGRTTKIAPVRDDGECPDIETIPTPVTDGLDDFFASLVTHICILREQMTSHGTPPVGVGFSFAGLFDDDLRVMIYHPNSPIFQGVDIFARLREGFPDLPIHVDLDVNACCLGEYAFGVGKGSARFFCIVIGTGVGGNLIINGRPLRITHNCSGDVGYVIVNPSGRPCPGGTRGSMEGEISAPAIGARAKELVVEATDGLLVQRFRELGEITPRDVIECAAQKDELASHIIAEAGEKLGIGLASIAPIFKPDTIAIGGGVAEAGPVLLEAADRAFRDHTAPFYHEGVRVALARLGWRASLIGAAVPFFQDHYRL